MPMKFTKALALILASAAIMAAAAGCKETVPVDASSTPSEPARLKPSFWSNPLPPPELKYELKVPEENKAGLEEWKIKNKHAKVWLQIPNTEVNKPVVQTNNNTDYYRANLNGAYALEGTLWMDYECDLKTGKPEEMPQNTIIYGHNVGNPVAYTDDPNGTEFAQLLKFEDIEMAKKTPYVYVTTDSADLVYEIFAVFYTEASMKPIRYYLATFSDQDFKVLMDDVQARSLYRYPDVVPVTEKDKILTLSTCTYKYGNYYVNDMQRFVVMAKLVTDGEYVKTANIEEIPNPKQPTF